MGSLPGFLICSLCLLDPLFSFSFAVFISTRQYPKQSKNSAAPHSAVNPHKQQGTYAPIRKYRVDMPSTLYFIHARCVLYSYYYCCCCKTERRNRKIYARPRKIFHHSRSSLAGVMYVCLYTQAVFGDRGALGICKNRQFAPKTMTTSLSASFIRILFDSSLWASVAGGGSRQRSEAPCIISSHPHHTHLRSAPPPPNKSKTNTMSSSCAPPIPASLLLQGRYNHPQLTVPVEVNLKIS